VIQQTGEQKTNQLAPPHSAGVESEDDEEIDEDATAETTINRADFSIDDLDYNEIIAAIREVFSQGAEFDRDEAIRRVSHSLGFRRTGNRISEAIDSALIAAVKRGIIFNNRGRLALLTRNINDYTRDQLILSMLTAMGYTWQERDEAVRAAARHLGFTRTGAAIQRAFKSAINGAIRRGLLEADKNLIRKAR
jgi:hypothetical protein